MIQHERHIYPSVKRSEPIQSSELAQGAVYASELEAPSSARCGFTIIELLLVLGIVAFILAMLLPSLILALRGTAMTHGADKIVSVLGIAHQAAVTKSRTVEVRFYAYIDPEAPLATWQGRALQAFSIDDSGNATPITMVQRLPSTVILTTNQTLSTLMSLTNTTASNSYAIPRAGSFYTCYSFQIYRSGATSLAGNTNQSSWCVTIENATDDVSGATSPPANYTTIVVDPYNASLKTYRPTL